MDLEQFVAEHRKEIDRAIRQTQGCPPEVHIDDDERELWVMNDEGLYLWAKREGVEDI